MSTITDAIKKRKKEGGGQEAEGIVPVDLDEPDVEVPKEKSITRIAILAAVVLLVAGAAVTGIILYQRGLGVKSGRGRAGPPARSASLTQPEKKGALPGEDTQKAAPGPVSAPIFTPAEMSSTATESPPAPDEAQPIAPKSSPPAAEESAPATVAAPPQKGATPAPASGGATPEQPRSPKTDPFVAIKLQGIMRFDPAAPEALINGKAMKVGDFLGDIELVGIGDDSVKLRCGNVEKTIRY